MIVLISLLYTGVYITVVVDIPDIRGRYLSAVAYRTEITCVAAQHGNAAECY